MASNLPTLDEDLGEDDLVERLLEAGSGTPVELLRVAQQAHGCEVELTANIQALGRTRYLIFDAGSLLRDLAQLGLDLAFRPARLPDESHVVGFLCVQLDQASAEPLPQGIQAAQLGQHDVLDLGANGSEEIRGQLHGGVVLEYLVFEPLGAYVRLVTDMILPTPTDEVEVRAAVAPARHDDEPPAALTAPQRALEVVVVLAVSGATAAVQGEHALYALVEIFGDEGRVASFELLTVVLDLAEVVAVAEDVVEAVEGQRFWRGTAVATGAESGRGDPLQDLRGGVLPGGVQLDALDDERRSFLVDNHRTNLAALKHLTDVQVAEPGAGDRAALLGLGAHLVLHISVAALHLVLVYRVQDAFDHLAFERVAEVHDGGNDTDVELLKVAFGDGSVDGVAKDAVEVMDDDVIDILLGLDPSHHLLKDGTLFDLRCGAPRFDVLVHDISV